MSVCLKGLELKSFIDFVFRSQSTELKKLSKKEKLILFLSYKLKWGRIKIRKKTGISERYVRSFLKRFRESAY
ncbi:MAG: hypothetical protein LBU55_01265 [Elusimicrobiota bacterium]|nr:hypothetical protein [Elusimicrobiota bacterium]